MSDNINSSHNARFGTVDELYFNVAVLQREYTVNVLIEIQYELTSSFQRKMIEYPHIRGNSTDTDKPNTYQRNGRPKLSLNLPDSTISLDPKDSLDRRDSSIQRTHRALRTHGGRRNHLTQQIHWPNRPKALFRTKGLLGPSGSPPI